MRKMKAMALLTAVAVLFAAGAARAGDAASAAVDGVYTSFSEARKASEAQNLPILLRIGKGWCKSCSHFDKAFEEEMEFKAAVSKHAVLCAVDAKEGDGTDLARMYSVSDYPVVTFILANGNGDLLDRWESYWSSENFLEHLTAAVENPLTVHERMVRFREHPTEIDARKLGELRDYAGYYAEANAYYQRARTLNPASETNYDLFILMAMAKGLEGQLYGADAVRKQADAVMAASKESPKDLLKVAYTMGMVAKATDDMNNYVPYLKTAVDMAAGVEDESVRQSRSKLMPDYALHVEKNAHKAVEYKKASFAETSAPENWLENPNLLNNLAWWCFENEINLDEAEDFARKGIELAEEGTEKGNILDTLAEICNLKGDCGEAVDYIRLAVAEDPDNPYFQKQLVRFEKLLADMK